MSRAVTDGRRSRRSSLRRWVRGQVRWARDLLVEFAEFHLERQTREFKLDRHGREVGVAVSTDFDLEPGQHVVTFRLQHDFVSSGDVLFVDLDGSHLNGKVLVQHVFFADLLVLNAPHGLPPVALAQPAGESRNAMRGRSVQGGCDIQIRLKVLKPCRGEVIFYGTKAEWRSP